MNATVIILGYIAQSVEPEGSSRATGAKLTWGRVLQAPIWP